METTEKDITLEQKALAIPDQAIEIRIVDAVSYEKACGFLLTIKDIRKEIEDTFKPITQRAHATWKETLAQRQRHENPLIRAEGIIKPRIRAYQDAEEQKRLEEQRVVREAAQVQEAIDAEARGDHVGAEAAISGQGVATPTVAPSIPKVAGIQQRETWNAEVFDVMLLFKAVVSGTVPTACVMPNYAALNIQARALKQTMNYPGVKAVCLKTVAGGRR